MPDEFEVTARTVGLVVNAPHIFGRVDFMEWLNDESFATATFHPRGKGPTECSDVFVLIDSEYEGDSSTMPADIWEALCDMAYQAFCGGKPDVTRYQSHIVVRLTNLEL